MVLLRLPAGVFAVRRQGDGLHWKYLARRPAGAPKPPDQSGLLRLLRDDGRHG